MKRKPIDKAPKDGTKFIGLKGDQAFTTWSARYYVKWPHELGGPTYRDAWNHEELDAILPWGPTHWIPFPPETEE